MNLPFPYAVFFMQVPVCFLQNQWTIDNGQLSFLNVKMICLSS